MPLPGPGSPQEVRCPALAIGTGTPGVAELGPARPARPVAAKAPQTSAIVARSRSFLVIFTLFCCVSGRAARAVRAQRWAQHMLSRLCGVANASGAGTWWVSAPLGVQLVACLVLLDP